MEFNERQKRLIEQLHLDRLFSQDEEYKFVFDSFDDDEKEEVINLK